MTYRIDGQTLSLILERGDDQLLYLTWFGPSDLESIAVKPGFEVLPASPDRGVGPTLFPEHGRGYHGIPQLEAFSLQSQKRVRLCPPEVRQSDEQLTLISRDDRLGVQCETQISFEGDALAVSATLRNGGTEPISVTRAASCLLPLPSWSEEILTHSGSWAHEGHPQRRTIETGRVEQLGRGGRPGFDGGPTITLCGEDTTWTDGQAMLVHLAWSGPFRLAIERTGDGLGQVLAERLFAPGELILQAGEEIELPEAVIALSQSGLNGVSKITNHAVRQHSRKLPRPVHFNTWEARYFRVSKAECIKLADAAADIGAERFILDDGWFLDRNDDTSSLGDWSIDPAKFPSGLLPLIKHVHDKGMSFGLWVEPEMISPRSNLYKAHPDWVLGYPDEDLPTGRNQLVLDFALPEVREHMFDVISALLDEYPIDYLKWDCNRDLYPSTRFGVERPGAQTEGVYELLDRLRATYPVEIESCASGGGRIDLGIAPRVDRFWTSDATDAVERLRIQRAASLLIPHEMLGSHVGPDQNPITGRCVPMAFRCLTALFGHFGIEADPATFSDDDKSTLKRAISLYKGHQEWMQSGQLFVCGRVDGDPYAELLLSEDQSEAFLRVMRVNACQMPRLQPIRLTGLDQNADYQVTEYFIKGEKHSQVIGTFTGAGLCEVGMSCDPGRPLTGRLFHLKRVV